MLDTLGMLGRFNVFFDFRTDKRRPCPGSHFFEMELSKRPERPISTEWEAQHGEHSRFLEEAEGPVPAAYPVRLQCVSAPLVLQVQAKGSAEHVHCKGHVEVQDHPSPPPPRRLSLQKSQPTQSGVLRRPERPVVHAERTARSDAVRTMRLTWPTTSRCRRPW